MTPKNRCRDCGQIWPTPAVANTIVGHRSARPVEDRYIQVVDEELLKAVDSMSFDHGAKELNFAEEFYEKGVKPTGAERIRKNSRTKEEVALLKNLRLDKNNNRSVLSECSGG